MQNTTELLYFDIKAWRVIYIYIYKNSNVYKIVMFINCVGNIY